MNTRQKALFLCCTLLLLLSPTASRAAPTTDETTDPYLIIYTAALIFDGVLDVERGGIFVMKANGTDIRQLTSFQTVNFDFAQHGLNLPDDHPSISPDGKFVAFTSNRDDRNNWEIYVMEINGANPRRLTNNPGLDTEPVWSPDGKRIAFSSERNGQKFNIWTMDSKNGLNLQQVTTNAAEDLEPAFSPDGIKIAFSRIVGDHEKDVFLINTDGSGERIMRQQPGEDHDPTWSPDGTEVVITSEIAGTPPLWRHLACACVRWNLSAKYHGESASRRRRSGLVARWHPSGALCQHHFDSAIANGDLAHQRRWHECDLF